MERILLGFLFLSELLSLSTCRQYHFVNQSLTWSEALIYCRQTHRDLASIKNAEENAQLKATLDFAGHKTDVRIGLYDEINWKWSDGFSSTGADYRNWATSDRDPDFISANQFCVGTHQSGKWWDLVCSLEYPFICYNGTHSHREFIFVNKSMDWLSAQTYCRKTYIDLATISGFAESKNLGGLVSYETWAWIGLFRDRNFIWSDGSSFQFSSFDNVENLIELMKVTCGVTSVEKSVKWKFLSCENMRLPFVCYSLQTEIKTVTNMMIGSEDSEDLSNLILKANILKKIQDRLEEKGVRGVSLKWKEQPQGKQAQEQKEG